MTHSTHKTHLTQALIALALTALATLYLEHSAFDVMVAQTLYLGGGHWLIDKAAVLPDLIFYSGIKAVLIALEVCLIGLFLYRHYQQKRSPKPTADTLLSQTELGYLVLTMLLVPLVVGALKAVTHVSCPAYLQLFGGGAALFTAMAKYDDRCKRQMLSSSARQLRICALCVGICAKSCGVACSDNGGGECLGVADGWI